MENGNDFQPMVAWKRVVRYFALAALITIAMVASSTKYQWIKLEGANELPRIWLTLSLFTTLLFSVWLYYELIKNKRYGIDSTNNKRASLFLFFIFTTFYIVIVAILNLSGSYTDILILTILSGPVLVLLLYIYDRNVLELEKILLKTHLREFFNTTAKGNSEEYCTDLSELLKNDSGDKGEHVLISITDIDNRLEGTPRELAKDLLEQFPLLHDEAIVNGVHYKQCNDVLKKINIDIIEFDKVSAVVRQLDLSILIGVFSTTIIYGLMYTGLNGGEIVGVADSTARFTDFIQGFVSGATGLQVIVGNIAFDFITSRA